VITIDFTTKPEITHEYVIDDLGNKYTYDENRKLHSYSDLPALIMFGVKSWYKHGKLHRDNNLPAIIGKYGKKTWYENGKRIK